MKVELWIVGAIRFGGQLVIHLSWCITGLMPSAQMVSWVCFSLPASTLNISDNPRQSLVYKYSQSVDRNRNNTTLLLWTWNFGIAVQFVPFAIPSINSALKQKTANYSATHRQHDNKATYKQICKSYSQLTNTLSLSPSLSLCWETQQQKETILSLKWLPHNPPCLSFHLPLLSRSLSFAFPPCLSDMQPSMQTYAHSCLLFLCPSVCLSCRKLSE